VGPVAARNRGVVGVNDPMAPTVTMVPSSRDAVGESEG